MTATAPLVLTASALENPPIDVLVDAAVRAGFDALSLWPGAGYGTDPDHRRVIDDAGLYVWDVDAAVLHQVATAKQVPFGPEVLIAYVAAKETEFTAVRIIMAGRIAGLKPDVIRERLRESYV